MQTVSEAQQNLASLLEQSQLLGGLQVQHSNGQMLILLPESCKPSPLDVAGVELG
ncbi:MAG: hypothetical protein SFX18_01215 [Pirellulales bacterium]|nr:hypothetical protein [Pirellulales bacterium]